MMMCLVPFHDFALLVAFFAILPLPSILLVGLVCTFWDRGENS